MLILIFPKFMECSNAALNGFLIKNTDEKADQ